MDKSVKYHFNANYFDDIDTSDKAYWLGFLYADGYITSARKYNSKKVGVSLSLKDIEHLENLKRALSSNAKIGIYTVTSGYKVGAEYCRVLFTGNHMADALISHGMFEHKTDILMPPNISIEFAKDFIRGYFDGDGSVWVQKGPTGRYDRYNVSFEGTDSLLYYIQVVLFSAGAISRLYELSKRKPGQTVSHFKFGGNDQVFRFLNYIYDGSHYKLDRKYQKYLELRSIHHSRPHQ